VLAFITIGILIYVFTRLYENLVENDCNELLSALISFGFIWLVVIVVDETYLKKLFNATAHEISKAVAKFFIGQ
jgi:hypothetical protein